LTKTLAISLGCTLAMTKEISMTKPCT